MTESEGAHKIDIYIFTMLYRENRVSVWAKKKTFPINRRTIYFCSNSILLRFSFVVVPEKGSQEYIYICSFIFSGRMARQRASTPAILHNLLTTRFIC